MPFVDPDIIRFICNLQQDEYEAVVPFSEGGQEPLHAVYSSKCRAVFESAINNGERKILDILPRMKVCTVTWEEMKDIGGSTATFLNVNTPEEFGAIRDNR